MRILTFNICWEAMKGATDSPHTLARKCYKLADGTTICMRNLIDFMNSCDSYDIIGIQEAILYHQIIKKSTTLQKLNYISHRSGDEDMITFYNPSYKLKYVSLDEFEQGRPFQILVFETCLIIQVHNSHAQSIPLLEKHISRGFDSLRHLNSNRPIAPSVYNKICENIASGAIRVIALGDFNLPWVKSKFSLNPFKYSKNTQHAQYTKHSVNSVNSVKVKADKIIKSCCSDKLAEHVNHIHSGDFILANTPSSTPIINQLPETYDITKIISDHLPVMADI